MAWGLAVALFVHCVGFVAVAYFGQIQMAFYLALAAVGSLGAAHPVRRYRLRRVRSAPGETVKGARPCLR